MRLGITSASWWLLGLGVAVGWCWGQGRVPLLDRIGLESRVGEALREPDTLKRYEALARTLRGVTAANQGDAFAGFEANQVGIEEPEIDVVIHALTRVDPAAALARVKSWPPRGLRVYAMREVFFAWAQMDPGAARLAFDEQVAPTQDAFEVQRKLVSGWARSGDIVGVTDYLAGLDSPVPRQELTTEVAEARLKDGGVDAVIHWSEALDPEAPEELRRDVFVKAARVVALADPQRAAEWVEGYAGQDGTIGAIRVVGLKWAQEDPKAALAWARGLKEEQKERRMVLNQAFQQLLQTDPEGAEAYLGDTPLEAEDDMIVGVFAAWIAKERPTDALAWAERIQDETLRVQTLTAIARVWHSQDPDAAVAWLDRSDLPEEMRRVALEPPRDPRQGPPGMQPGMMGMPQGMPGSLPEGAAGGNGS